MEKFNFRDYLFKDRPGEDPGQRAEILVTLLLGTLSTLLPLLVYRNPITVTTAVITNVISLFTLYQAVRARYNYLILFPAITSISICLVSIVEGAGTHDLIWMGNLGLFLIANIYSRKNILVPTLLAILMIATFAGTGAAEINNILPNPFGTNAQYVYLNSFFFATIMAATVVVFQRHYALLQIARENKNVQIKTNLELQEINQNLEVRVENRTRELSEISRQTHERATRLQTISEISKEISLEVNQQPKELLRLITHSISEKLGFYHVGIFLFDENREYAVLRAANSQGGQRMLERHHQLKIGGTGVVGYVSQSGRPRISLDTGSDAVFFNNPDLPETHSEMALPLKYGNKIIGVLDIQSTLSSAFNDEDVNLLSTLANQITIVIDTVVSNNRAGYTGISKKSFTRNDKLLKQNGYSYLPDGTISTARALTSPTLDQALASGETVILDRPSKDNPSTLAVPVKFREQVIGFIHVEAAEANRKWTEDEVAIIQSISDRASLAIENARLYEETERRAEHEQLIAQVTSRIGESNNMESILQTTIQELGRTLGATRTFIKLEAASSAANDDLHQKTTAD